MSVISSGLEKYSELLNKVVPILAALLITTAIVSPSGGQPVAALILLLCLPLVFSPKGPLGEDSKALLWTLMFPLFASIPLFYFSETGEALAGAARFFLAGVVLLVLGNLKLSPKLLLRSATAGGILAVMLHIGELGEPRVNWGVGYLDSGYVAVMLLCLSLGQFHFDKGHNGWRLFALIGIGCLVLAVMKTGTRGAWPVMIVVFLLQFLLLDVSRRQKVVFATLGLTVFAASLLLVPSIKDRIDLTYYEIQSYSVDSNRASSMGYRLDLWHIALRCFAESPLLGVSYQRRSEIMQEYTKARPISSNIGDDGRSSSHNEILNAMAKKGLLGVIAILLLYLVPMRYFISRVSSSQSEQIRTLGLAGVALVITMIFCGITEAPLMNVRVGTTYGFLLVFLYRMIIPLVTKQKI